MWNGRNTFCDATQVFLVSREPCFKNFIWYVSALLDTSISNTPCSDPLSGATAAAPASVIATKAKVEGVRRDAG